MVIPRIAGRQKATYDIRTEMKFTSLSEQEAPRSLNRSPGSFFAFQGK